MELDRMTLEILRDLDDPVPDVTAEDVIARAGRARRRSPMRWAAGVALVLASAGAAYALPGSPVPAWLERLGGSGAQVEPQPVAPPPVGEAGVLLPVDGPLVIDFGVGEGSVEVRLSDDPEVSLVALDGPATFDSRPARLLVSATEARAYRVTIPRRAPSVEIVAGGRRLAHVVLGTPDIPVTPGPDGTYTLSLVPQG